jgi:serine/threonine protein kinase/class 3 adenylate cyclase
MLLGRPVALKELHPQLLNNNEWVQRFTREARMIARLDHRRIVTIYDVVEGDGRLFIVMRLVDGPSLDVHLATEGAVPWSETLTMMRAISEGLDFAHSQGILHRDLKPGNILLDPHRGALLSDFGLAKLIGEAGSSFTAAGGIVGSPHYLAPEVWEGQGAARQSDIYALGCILYETLTGEQLFKGDTLPTVMTAHFRPIVLPRTWPGHIPPAVADVLRVALAKKPSDRYGTAGEMIAELAKVGKTEPQTAVDKGTPTRGARTPGTQAVSALRSFKEPETRYAWSGDISVAYQVIGDGPFDLVMIPGFVSHLEVAWEYPPYARFLRRLASFSRLIVFDKRGTGLSDRTASIASLEERTDDVRAVMDAVGSKRAAFFSVSEGGPMSILFAATYPERTIALVIWGSGARFSWAPDYPWTTKREDWPQILEGFRQIWGRRTYDTDFAPSMADDEGFQQWWAKLCRLGASPGAVVALWRMNMEIDVRPVLPTIRVPSLVMHRTGDRAVPVAAARYIAGLIPGAKYVELPGEDHAWWTDDALLKEIEAFLTVKRPSIELDRVLATILFAEIVGLPEAANEPGDRQRGENAEEYYHVARKEIDRFRGRSAKKTGEMFQAIFDGPSRAIRCAQSLQEWAKGLGIELRVALHIGEIELMGDDIAGIAVQIAAEILAKTRKCEIWVSGTVKDLVAGSGIQFREQGTLQLVAIPGEWPLFAVEE